MEEIIYFKNVFHYLLNRTDQINHLKIDAKFIATKSI